MSAIIDIIAAARTSGASDVHLTEGFAPVFRIHGELTTQPEPPVTAQDILSMAGERGPEVRRQDLDFALDAAGGRQRVNIYREQGRLAATIRLLNDTVPPLEQLGLPAVLQKMAEEPRGLILVTGPTGSGKSTTLAAMIHHVANRRSRHILTVEDPIEYVYGQTRSLIHQREVGRDVESFSAALRSAMREDPDVILVGEMRDYETISAAVTAAETGHLVLSTLHTTGASKTIDRIIDVFPPHAQNQIRSQLASVLRGVVTQQLLPMTPDPLSGQKRGRVPATEIMLGIDAIANLIREGKIHQINSTLQSKTGLGMMTMDFSLAALVRERKITRETAEAYASAPDELRQLLQSF